MELKLIHCSDLHLGRQRLNGKLPERDLAEALKYIVNYTIESRAQGLLIAGDLFDSPQIQPPQLQMALDALTPLKEQGIPVFAIEGNHDRASLTATAPTWVRYLNNQGYLQLLNIPFTAEGPEITPWDPVNRSGSYLDYQGIRIMGAGYLGAGTPRRMKAIAEVLEKMEANQPHVPTILLLHAGPEYIVHEGGGYDQDSLEFIRGLVDFIALGHIHKPLHHGWAVNPGTAENIRVEEAGYNKAATPRGMAELIVDLDGPAISAEILPVPRRPMVKVEFDCSSLKGRNMAEKLQQQLLEQVRSLQVTPETVLRLELIGSLNLTRAGLDVSELAAFLEQEVPVIAVDIGLTKLNQESHAEQTGSGEDNVFSREIIERQAIQELLHNDPIPQLGDEVLPEQVELLLDLKGAVRDQTSAEEILERLNSHQVVAKLWQQLKLQRAQAKEAAEQVAAGNGGETDAD